MTAQHTENRCDIDELRGLFIFDGLTDAQMSRLCRSGQVQTIDEGVLCAEGDPAVAFYVLLDGEIALTSRSGAQNIEILRTSEPGSWCGALSAFLLDDSTTYEVTAMLTRRSRLFRIDATDFGTFLRDAFPMATHLLVGHSSGRSHQHRVMGPHDRLVQLGQLTAGLTHELNNPAAAALRAANALRERNSGLRRHLAELANEVGAPDGLQTLIDLQEHAAARAVTPPDLSSGAKSDLEEGITEWLESHSVTNPWDSAAIFVDAGLDTDWLERVAATVGSSPARSLDRVVRWLSDSVEAEQLLSEISDSTARIAALVDQVKIYSQLDRAPVAHADVHELLESALTMMSHRLTPRIRVIRDFEAALPELPCFPAELNQVWTCLLDNAIDALDALDATDALGSVDPPRGLLTVRTRRLGDMVRVEVCDSGAGIRADVLHRIFDPFFTTKPFGEGTGLGLDVAARIVDRHHGSLWAESEPGATRFIVSLPLGAGLATDSVGTPL